MSVICKRTLSPGLGDEAGCGVGFSYRHAKLHIGWRVGTTTRRDSPALSSIKRLRIGPLNKIFLVQAEPTRKESKLSRKNKAKKEGGVPLGNSSNAVVLTSTQLGKALFVL